MRRVLDDPAAIGLWLAVTLAGVIAAFVATVRSGPWSVGRSAGSPRSSSWPSRRGAAGSPIRLGFPRALIVHRYRGEHRYHTSSSGPTVPSSSRPPRTCATERSWPTTPISLPSTSLSPWRRSSTRSPDTPATSTRTSAPASSTAAARCSVRHPAEQRRKPGTAGNSRVTDGEPCAVAGSMSPLDPATDEGSSRARSVSPGSAHPARPGPAADQVTVSVVTTSLPSRLRATA